MTSNDSASARRAMIDSQLRPSGVNEAWVLAAMGALPREDYVPAAMKDAAYIDRAIALGTGGWLAAPIVQGRMLAEAAPRKDDAALVIDGGSGYLAALLKPQVGKLTVIAADAMGDAAAGIFSLIVIDGAVEQVPDAISAALVENGRLVCGIADGGITRLTVGRKVAGMLALLPLADIGMPVLAAGAKERAWSF